MHCLAGIFKPDSGEIWFGGQRLDQLSEKKRTELRRSAFGFVFQFGQLVPELTAADNVAIPLVLNRSGADPAVSSGVFVTTITDVVGFFSFLAIATVWFGLR